MEYDRKVLKNGRHAQGKIYPMLVSGAWLPTSEELPHGSFCFVCYSLRHCHLLRMVYAQRERVPGALRRRGLGPVPGHGKVRPWKNTLLQIFASSVKMKQNRNLCDYRRITITFP